MKAKLGMQETTKELSEKKKKLSDLFNWKIYNYFSQIPEIQQQTTAGPSLLTT